MSSLPKPILRGHAKRRGFRSIVGSLCFAAMNGTLYHYFVNVPRREAYEESIRTYDGVAHYKDLVKWGYLQDYSVKK